METLTRRRGVIKATITKLETYAKAATNEISYDDLKVRLDRIQDAKKEFTEIENQMFKLNPKEDSDEEVITEQYYYIVARLNSLIRAKTTNTCVNLNESFIATFCNPPVSDFKLQPCTIPYFDGKYEEWQSFHDLFKATIHEKNNLSPSQKFQYLKGLLKGEASALIRHFRVDDANYIEAFQRLCKRYDKKRYIMNTFLQSYIDQAPISKPTSTNIAKILDKCDEVVRGLKAIGPDAEERDPWLIYLAVQKLDPETQQMWRVETAEKDFPKIQEFFDFLSIRMDSLQGAKSDQHSIKQGSFGKRVIKALHSSTVGTCVGCNMASEHKLYSCPTFLDLSILNRRQMVKTNGICFNCLSAKHQAYQCRSRGRCAECKKRHNTLLHIEQTQGACATVNDDENKPNPIKDLTTGDSTCQAAILHINTTVIRALLPTAEIQVRDLSNQWLTCRAMLDSGSQTSFVTEALVNRLRLPRNNSRISIKGVSGTNAGISRGVTELYLSSRMNNDFKINIQALILPKITNYEPSRNLEQSIINNLSNLKMADPEFLGSRKIDILIGCDHFFDLICDGQLRGADSRVIAQNSRFGWIVAGGTSIKENNTDSLVAHPSLIIDIDASLRRFWESEEVQEGRALTQEEKTCVQKYEETVARAPDNKYIVSLPFHDNFELGVSKYVALKRFKSLEIKLSKNHSLEQEYKHFLKEYKELGHMAEDLNPISRGYYLPHHAVVKQSSTTTKLRVVFDGSAATTNGKSLNDALLVGPTVQQSLFNILIRFRKHKIVFTADIEKMFRQIWVREEDTAYQRILWRESAAETVKTYRLLTVTYGTSAAPFLATQTLHQLSKDYDAEYPNAANILRRDFYVDDLMSGEDNLEQSQQLVAQLIALLAKGGFTLRKWTSNDQRLLKTIPKELQEISTRTILEKEDNSIIKVLGLEFNPTHEYFQFKVALKVQAAHTKRSLLSEASRLFDPMGWLSPTTIAVKILFQRLWLEKIDWDDQLPPDIQAAWVNIRNEMKILEEIKISRWMNLQTSTKFELHGFSDASENAYGAVVYSRVKIAGTYKVNIMVAKTKVAPIKTVSLPRLELNGALMLAKLMEAVRFSLAVQTQPLLFYWTDSQIVLDWLSSPPRRWKTYVANRTAKILELTNRSQWSHVESTSNPADCATRGLMPSALKEFNLWWNGPNWLQNREDSWIKSDGTYIDDKNIMEQRDKVTNFHIATEENCAHILFNKISCIIKIQRIVAWIHRFVKNASTKGKIPRVVNLHIQNFDTLNYEEIEKALTTLIKIVQHENYSAEINALEHGLQISKKSKLISYSPFLDTRKILRVGGRLENANLPFGVRHPIFLPSKHKLTELIIKDEHWRNLHAGPTLLINILKQRYHIFRCKDAVKRVINPCTKCRRYRAKRQEQIMGDLPSCRVTFSRPFLETGVDYGGPYWIRSSRLRGAKQTKCYLVVFVCMGSKAVHLELATDLSTDCFLAVLRRFQSRRGICKTIHSDNGSNFIGAARELKEITSIMASSAIQQYSAERGTSWQFIPPASPHFGGIWEAAVKSMKYHLRRVIGDSILTYEELLTLLVQIEGMLNSRPLCQSNDELDPLTPGHFLIGHPLTLMPEPDLTHHKQSTLSRWQHLQQMSQHFWRRWQNEYLLTLQQRHKWKLKSNNLQLDDIVIIMDNTLPPAKWMIGRVIELHPGKDSAVRVVTLKTKTGMMKRPVNKLSCLVPQLTQSSQARRDVQAENCTYK